jgi:hypothetical protein
MIMWLRHFLGWLRSAFCAREDLILENLALRQQLLALHSQRPRRRLTAWHKLFWVVLRSLWTRWKEPLILARIIREYAASGGWRREVAVKMLVAL